MRRRMILIAGLVVVSLAAPVVAHAAEPAPNQRAGVFTMVLDTSQGPDAQVATPIELTGRFVIGGQAWSGTVNLVMDCCTPDRRYTFVAAGPVGLIGGVIGGTCRDYREVFSPAGSVQSSPPGVVPPGAPILRLDCIGGINYSGGHPFVVVLSTGLETDLGVPPPVGDPPHTIRGVWRQVV